MQHQFLYQRATGKTADIHDAPENVERDDKIGSFVWEKYVLAQIVDPDVPDKMEFQKRGGVHLGTVRSWIQWNCLNGDSVTWGSENRLNFKGLTVKDVEMLAVDIAYNVLKEKGLVK